MLPILPPWRIEVCNILPFHTMRFKVYLLVLAFVTVIAAAIQAVATTPGVSDEQPGAALGLTKRAPNHKSPIHEFNDSYHRPALPSYWSIDIDDPNPPTKRHPGLMLVHGVLMSSAFFVALPMSELYTM
jgi:hypothetical protein